jgi:hypothetical protein
MFDECKVFFEKRLGETYGTYTLVDHHEFILFLRREIGWVVTEELEYDLEELIDEYIENDPVYKTHIH